MKKKCFFYLFYYYYYFIIFNTIFIQLKSFCAKTESQPCSAVELQWRISRKLSIIRHFINQTLNTLKLRLQQWEFFKNSEEHPCQIPEVWVWEEGKKEQSWQYLCTSSPSNAQLDLLLANKKKPSCARLQMKALHAWVWLEYALWHLQEEVSRYQLV